MKIHNIHLKTMKNMQESKKIKKRESETVLYFHRYCSPSK